MSAAWRTALRRGLIPLALGVVCLLAAVPAIEDLHSLLVGLGVLFLLLGAVIVLGTARRLVREGGAEPARVSPDGRGNL